MSAMFSQQSFLCFFPFVLVSGKLLENHHVEWGNDQRLCAILSRQPFAKLACVDPGVTIAFRNWCSAALRCQTKCHGSRSWKKFLIYIPGMVWAVICLYLWDNMPVDLCNLTWAGMSPLSSIQFVDFPSEVNLHGCLGASPASHLWHRGYSYKVVPPQWCLLVYTPMNYRYTIHKP